MRLVIRRGKNVMHILEQEITAKGTICKASRDAIVRAIARGWTVELMPLMPVSEDVCFPAGAD